MWRCSALLCSFGRLSCDCRVTIVFGCQFLENFSMTQWLYGSRCFPAVSSHCPIIMRGVMFFHSFSRGVHMSCFEIYLRTLNFLEHCIHRLCEWPQKWNSRGVFISFATTCYREHSLEHAVLHFFFFIRAPSTPIPVFVLCNCNCETVRRVLNTKRKLHRIQSNNQHVFQSHSYFTEFWTSLRCDSFF